MFSGIWRCNIIIGENRKYISIAFLLIFFVIMAAVSERSDSVIGKKGEIARSKPGGGEN